MAENVGSHRAVISPRALLRPLPGDEAVLLDLESEVYFGLNSTGLRMWNALKSSPDLEAALALVLDGFDADPGEVRRDFEQFVAELVERGLVQVTAA